MEIRSVSRRTSPRSSGSSRGSRRATARSSRRTSPTRTWSRSGGAAAASPRIAVDGPEVVGYGAVIPLQGWSSHVGEVRVIVDPGSRRQGVGRALGRRAVLSALELGLEKLVVEVIADQEPTIAMFRSLGFDPEALLEDHVRDQAGELHDLMILGLSVEESWASLQSTGIAEGLSG